LAELKIDSLVSEIAANKSLIDMTSGGGDEKSDEGGSDSEPSEDNLEEWELEKITTIPLKKQLKRKSLQRLKKLSRPNAPNLALF